ncbi:hypothetical protein K501DRAFT_303514 [Backusella circina FSU 941]|nr:hypothetical protein K501DRAFT_303514 [Backusella circina FSU 941]
MTDSVLYNNELDKEKKRGPIKGIESRILAPKTTNREKYMEYTEYMLLNMHALFQFYNDNRAEGRFLLYPGCQRAKEKMANMLLNGDTKYNNKRRKHIKKNHKRRKKLKVAPEKKAKAILKQSKGEKGK